MKGYKELGKRYAEKMLELLGDNPLQATGISLSAMLLKDSNRVAYRSMSIRMRKSSLDSRSMRMAR